MECQRLNKMIRSWYVQVQDETLAPARMVEFMEKHVRNCDECLLDANIREELAKITAIVLPPSKMTKPPKSAAAPPAGPSAAELKAIESEEETDSDEEDKDEDDDDIDDDDLDDDDIEVDDDDDMDGEDDVE